MASVSIVEVPRHQPGVPSWIEPSLNVTPGRDPLGLQTITLDRTAQQEAAAISRRESVESPLGGYGLYYRSPMIDMGMVVPRGSALGETITPIDVLDPNGLGPALADAFGNEIADTSYYREHILGRAAIPRATLEELAEKACLCRLPDNPDEQALLRRALFEPPAPTFAAATKQRCRSFALLLRELERDPQVAASNGAFMQAVWDDFLSEPIGDAPVRRSVAEWAALAAKDWWQESLSSVWSHFLRVAGTRPRA